MNMIHLFDLIHFVDCKFTSFLLKCKIDKLLKSDPCFIKYCCQLINTPALCEFIINECSIGILS